MGLVAIQYKDADGRTIVEIQQTGECHGNNGSYLGQFIGYTHHEMKVCHYAC